MRFLETILADMRLRALKKETSIDTTDGDIERQSIHINTYMREFISNVSALCEEHKERFPYAFADAMENLYSHRTHIRAAINYLTGNPIFHGKKKTDHGLFRSVEIYVVYEEAKRIVSEHCGITNFEPYDNLWPLENAIRQVEYADLYKKIASIDPKKGPIDTAYRTAVRKVIDATTWIEGRVEYTLDRYDEIVDTALDNANSLLTAISTASCGVIKTTGF